MYGIMTFGHGMCFRRNAMVFEGRCENCGYQGRLKTYDATHCFTFNFIPFAPIKRLRVVTDCPKCKKCTTMSPQEWRDHKQSIFRGYEDDPSDAERGIEAMDLAMLTKDHERFLAVAVLFEQAHDENPDAMVGLASRYGHLKMSDEAIGAYEQALMLKDDPDIRDSYALYLIRHGLADAANEQVSHLIATKNPRFAPTAIALAQRYMEHDRAREAMTLMDQAEASWAGITKQGEAKKLYKKCRKANNRA